MTDDCRMTAGRHNHFANSTSSSEISRERKSVEINIPRRKIVNVIVQASVPLYDVCVVQGVQCYCVTCIERSLLW